MQHRRTTHRPIALNDAILCEVASELKARFQGRLQRIILFGSRARGDADDDSDYDCLLVFDETPPEAETVVEDLSARTLLHEGVVLSLWPMSEADLKRMRFEPFILNAQREGIAL